MLTALAVGVFYLSTYQSTQTLLNEITFSSVDTFLGNGVPADTVWGPGTFDYQKAVLAKLQSLGTFLALAVWDRTTPISNTSLPYFFELPEPAISVKTYLAGQSGIPYQGTENNLVGYLLSPTRLGLNFATGDVLSGRVFNGTDVTNGPQELAIIIVYSIS